MSLSKKLVVALSLLLAVSLAGNLVGYVLIQTYRIEVGKAKIEMARSDKFASTLEAYVRNGAAPVPGPNEGTLSFTGWHDGRRYTTTFQPRSYGIQTVAH